MDIAEVSGEFNDTGDGDDKGDCDDKGDDGNG
jgi:hypothetical protein